MGVLAARRRLSVWWCGATVAPIVIHAALLWLASQHGTAGTISRYVRVQVNTDALLLEAFVSVIAGPLMGVVSTARRSMSDGGASSIAGCGLFAAIFAASAAIAHLVVDPATPVAALVAPHVTLSIATLAATALGAAAAASMDHPLDAAGCALLLSLLAGVGVLVSGPLVADAPAGLVNAALAASPIVATASAANIDVLRGDLLYRFSPIAHRAFDYPSWTTACLIYAALAAIAFMLVVMRVNPRGRTLPAERITV
ncbi:MAG TPA: hypothetical protein VLV86_24615 [Vicinamibacterales bacterium]|nr:hypothetical protein [Vicinamibacterales bacterium]